MIPLCKQNNLSRSSKTYFPAILGLFSFLGILLVPLKSHCHWESFFRSLLPARQFISAGTRGPRIAEILENYRTLYLQHAAPTSEQQSAARFFSEITKNENILKVLSRIDPIPLERAQTELSELNKAVEQIKLLHQSLGSIDPPFHQVLLGNEQLLIYARSLAEIRLLAAEVHHEGPHGIAVVRKRLKAELAKAKRRWHDFYTTPYQPESGPREPGAFLREEERLHQEIERLNKKLSDLLDLEITLSGSIAREFSYKHPSAAIADAESLVRVLRDEMNRLRDNLDKAHAREHEVRQARDAYNAMSEALEEAKRRLEVMKQTKDAWVELLHAP